MRMHSVARIESLPQLHLAPSTGRNTIDYGGQRLAKQTKLHLT